MDAAWARHAMCESAFSILREISVPGYITLPRTPAKWRESILTVVISIMGKAVAHVYVKIYIHGTPFQLYQCFLSLNLMFFSTVHHSIELFHQPTLMHNFFYSLTICLLHYYPRHVSSINMPIFRRKNCIHTASGIFALCKRLHSTLVESGLETCRG